MEQEKKIEDYNQEEDVKESPKMIEATIISREIVSAFEAFGEKAYDKEQKVFKINVEYVGIDQRIHEKSYFVNYYPKGAVPDASKFGQFLKRYKSFKEGIKVDMIKNSDGHYDLGLN